jgi:hypothetical protein
MLTNNLKAREVLESDAIILVGSASSDRPVDPEDYDLVCFNSLIDVGEEMCFKSAATDGKEVSWHVYSPHHFKIIIRSEELTAVWFREIKKLAFGSLLYDKNQTGKIVMNLAKEARFPPTYLRTMCSNVVHQLDQNGTASLDWSIEVISFVLLARSKHWYYTKPKWLLEDIRRNLDIVMSSLMTDISDYVSSQCLPASVWAEMSELPQRLSSLYSGELPTFQIHFKDAIKLQSSGLCESAVWPMRMGLYQAMNWLSKYDHNAPRFNDSRDLRNVPLDFTSQNAPIGRYLNQLSATGSPNAKEWMLSLHQTAIQFIRDIG